MTPLTEADAERYLAREALIPAHPRLVGLVLDLPLARSVPSGMPRLRLGFRTAGTDRVLVSGPPSPGLEAAVQRMCEDLGPSHPGAAVLVSLEAGTDAHLPTGMGRRWSVAHAIGTVLVAA